MQAQKGTKKQAAPEQKKKGVSQRAKKLSRAPVRYPISQAIEPDFD
jgi:hypothetical protein